MNPSARSERAKRIVQLDQLSRGRRGIFASGDQWRVMEQQSEEDEREVFGTGG